MTEWDFIAAPAMVKVGFAINQAEIVVNMLHLLNTVPFNTGLSQWMEETYHTLTPEENKANKLASMLLDVVDWQPEMQHFVDVINHLKNRDADDLRDSMLTSVFYDMSPQEINVMVDDVEQLVSVMQERAREHNKEEMFDEGFWRWLHMQISDAATLKKAGVDHLTMMWDRFVRDHWVRNEALLKESRDAFIAMNFSTFPDGFSAIEAITGRNMRGADKLEQHFSEYPNLIFMPVTHLGPYISWGKSADGDGIIYFSARVPQNTRSASPAFNRNELLVRLNALADDTRLRMLELLVENEEMCAQDFINQLDLSQSSASRHLRQLTASGYLNERRRDVAKCYTLNRERMQDTIKTLGGFLDKH